MEKKQLAKEAKEVDGEEEEGLFSITWVLEEEEDLCNTSYYEIVRFNLNIKNFHEGHDDDQSLIF